MYRKGRYSSFKKGSRTTLNPKRNHMTSHHEIKNMFHNSNNVYNNFIIQRGDLIEGPFSFLNIQKESVRNSGRVIGAGMSLVGQNKIKKKVYHLGKI